MSICFDHFEKPDPKFFDFDSQLKSTIRLWSVYTDHNRIALMNLNR